MWVRSWSKCPVIYQIPRGEDAVVHFWDVSVEGIFIFSKAKELRTDRQEDQGFSTNSRSVYDLGL